MITAELKHRDYVGYREIAQQFSSLNFYGNPSVIQPLNELSKLIEDSQNIKNKVKIKCLAAKKDDNNAKITLLAGQLRDVRKRLIASLLLKDTRAKIAQIKNEIQRLEEMNEKIYALIHKIEDLDNQYNRNYSNVHTLNREYKNLLTELGFSPKCSHHNDRTRVDHETYEFSGIDQQLFANANKKLEAYKVDLENRCEAIEANFTKQLLQNEIPYANSSFDEKVFKF